MRRTMLLGVLLAMGVVGIVAGQAPQQPNVAEIEKVRDNLFMIKGGGGNTAAFITSNRGVILVDTKDPGWGPAIMDKVRSVTDNRSVCIINTHTHGDHVGSNDFFPASVEVVAHENAKASMQKMKLFEGDNAQFLPDQTYTSKMTVLPGADRVELYHFGAGHTNGDTIVVFPALRRRPHRRSLRQASDARHRRRQWRQRRRLSRDAAQVRESHSGRRHRHSRPHADDDHVEGVRGVRRVQRGVPGRGPASVRRRQDRGRSRRGAHPSRKVQGLRDAERQGQRRQDLRRAQVYEATACDPAVTRRLLADVPTDQSSARRFARGDRRDGRVPDRHPADTLCAVSSSKRRPSRRFTPR